MVRAVALYAIGWGFESLWAYMETDKEFLEDMRVEIRPAQESDLPAYTDLLQSVYEEAYSNPELGLTRECFSKEVFATDETQEYLKSSIVNNEKQKAYIAFIGPRLVGSITVSDKGDVFEMKGFYVVNDRQGKGIGRTLWAKALEFAQGKDLVLDLYAHNTKAIDMYKSWGFELDTSRGKNGYFYRHWPEWPEGLHAKCVYMRRKT